MARRTPAVHRSHGMRKCHVAWRMAYGVSQVRCLVKVQSYQLSIGTHAADSEYALFWTPHSHAHSRGPISLRVHNVLNAVRQNVPVDPLGTELIVTFLHAPK